MKTKLLVVLMILTSSLLWAADKIQPLNIKLGLWETTSTFSMTGMPPIPADALANMTAEQRARLEQMMKARSGVPTTHTHKYCVTKEKLEKDLSFGEERGKCTHTIVSSSNSAAEVKFHCAEEGTSVDGTAKFEAISSENVKGSVHTVSSGNGTTMNSDIALTSRYLGPSCGDVK